MKAKINRVSLKLVEADFYSLTAEVFVVVTDPPLTLPALLQNDTAVTSSIIQIGWCDIGASVLIPHSVQLNHPLILTVPPKWGEASVRGKLANAVWSTLETAEANGFRSIVMPAIGTGVMGYPVENCAKVMLEQIVDFAFEPVKALREIIICLENEAERQVFERELMYQIDLLRSDDNTVRVS